MMEFPWHSGKVLEQLNRQRKQGLLCDCTFVVDGVDFKAHKAVLAACSVYFRTLFLDQKDVVHLDISNAAGRSSSGYVLYPISASSLLSNWMCCFDECRFRLGSGPGFYVHCKADFKSAECRRRAVGSSLFTDARNRECVFCLPVVVKSSPVRHNTGFCCWWVRSSVNTRVCTLFFFISDKLSLPSANPSMPWFFKWIIRLLCIKFVNQFYRHFS